MVTEKQYDFFLISWVPQDILIYPIFTAAKLALNSCLDCKSQKRQQNGAHALYPAYNPTATNLPYITVLQSTFEPYYPLQVYVKELDSIMHFVCTHGPRLI